jgi:Domain of unknown function (DUF4337)
MRTGWRTTRFADCILAREVARRIRQAETAVELHETREHVERAEHAQHQERKRTALLIIILAVALAIIEMAGKETQFASIAHNILSSDTYAFYQAKTIRMTFLAAAADAAEQIPEDAQHAEALHKLIAGWRSTIDRLDSDPATAEGRKELLARARSLEEERDREQSAYHHYEYSAAGLQLAIVIASAAVITEVTTLEIMSAAIGIAALGLAALGWLAPTLLPL